MLINVTQIMNYWKISRFNVSSFEKKGIIKPRVVKQCAKYFNYYDLVKELGPPLNVVELITELKKIQKQQEED